MSFAGEKWKLWRQQTRAVMRLELKKNFILRRGLWVYLLAFAPVALFAFRSFYLSVRGIHSSTGDDVQTFAAVFQLFFLRLAVFLGCAGIFMNLFRGEMLDKSLHYYFLAPVRREVLLAAKYLSGLLAAGTVFCSSTALQLIALDWHENATTLHEYLYHAHGLESAAAYLGVTALACAGYGGVFLAIGVLFRRALVPAVAVLIWEMINSLLPPVLQRISIIYYLKSLCPVQIPAITLRHDSLLTLISFNSGPASTAVAVFTLAALTLVLLIVGGLHLRKMEIDYGTE
jgi:ABC-type transport system involved in multi-copper enzyme maturation permease subunit